MTEIKNELIYEILKQLQAGQVELRAGQIETSRKIGAIAESLNSRR